MKESPATLPDEAPPPAGEATSSPNSRTAHPPPPPPHAPRRLAPPPAAPSRGESTNFEYEDSEWDVGIGNLIIDLDADIEKSASPAKANHPMPSGTSPPSPPTSSSSPANVASSAAGSANAAAPAKNAPPAKVPGAAPAETSGLKMKIKRTKPSPGTRSTEPKHEIVKTTEGVPVATPGAVLPVLNNNNNAASPGSKRALPANHKRDKAKEVAAPAVGKQKAPVVASPVAMLAAGALNGSNGVMAAVSANAAVVVAKNGNESPPAKKWRAGHLAADKVPSPPPSAPSTGPGAIRVLNGVHASSPDVSRVDVGVGTCSASTMTEPECLGPCEPGTAVTLEGIVWHETEGGVLVVNVTWRGKTYVGTLMDCTKNDWAPPRFCDSPTSDAESRAPKGRAKRGRGATGTPIPTNPLADPMHGKLRAKGRRNGPPALPAPPSPAKELANKRKSSVAEPANKRSRSNSRGASSPTVEQQPSSTSTNNSPMLIECPEPNCSKKYKHINGLKYHQSHAHSNSEFDEEDLKADKKEEAPFTGKVPLPPEAVEEHKEPPSEHLFAPIEPSKEEKKSESPSPVPEVAKPLAAPVDSAREEVQSPAYSDISDDQSPIDTDLLAEGKKISEKLAPEASMPFLGGYPYFGQTFVPPEQQQVKTEPDEKPPQTFVPPFHPVEPVELKTEQPVEEKKVEEKRPLSGTLIKTDKEEKKEEVKPAPPTQLEALHKQQEDIRRFYSVYEEQPIYQPMTSPNGNWAQRKPQQPPPKMPGASSPKLRPPSVDRPKESSSRPPEGVKPTMETQGPPPPPPTQGLYGMYPNPLYPYGLPFDPSHPAYRNTMMMGGAPFAPPQGGPPFGLPPQMSPQRYPFPAEEMNRAHALEMLQQQASQYYAALAPPPANPPPTAQQGGNANHKIHELTERALKSPPASPAVGGPPNAGKAPPRPPQGGGAYQYPPSSTFAGPKPLLRP